MTATKGGAMNTPVNPNQNPKKSITIRRRASGISA
jgi:hypothetical protein